MVNSRVVRELILKSGFACLLVFLMVCLNGMGSHPTTNSRRGVCGKIDVVKADAKEQGYDYQIQFYFRDNEPLEVGVTKQELVLLGYGDLNRLRELLEKDIIVVFVPKPDATSGAEANKLVKIHITERNS